MRTKGEERLPAFLPLCGFHLALVSTPELWKNLWIAGREKGLEAADGWFSFHETTRGWLSNCMEMMELASWIVHFASGSPLARGNYSCFKGFHRSALLTGYNFALETVGGCGIGRR